jgi:hypothetical protein
MDTLLLKWITLFCIIRLLYQIFVTIMIKNKYIYSETLRIYHTDMSMQIMFLSEVLIGCFLFFITQDYKSRVVGLLLVHTLLYLVFECIGGDTPYDYIHFYKRYFKENYHFIGILPLITSFVLMKYIGMVHVNKNYMYASLCLIWYYLIISSYEDL